MSRQYYHHATLTGTVLEVCNDGANFLLRTRAKDDFYVYTTGQTYWKSLKNLDETPDISRDRYGPYPTGGLSDEDRVKHYVAVGTLVVVEGVFSQNELRRRVDARTVHLLYAQDGAPISERKGPFAFERGHWWLSQITSLADGWLQGLWPNESQNYDFDKYLTNLDIAFRPTLDKTQESATLSRLIYGLSSAFLLTGCVRYVDAARAGVEFLRKHFRSHTNDGDHVIWAARRVNGVTMIESGSGEDKGTIPLYEQIYCLAGLAQFYRITQDWGVLDDIIRTVSTFQKFYTDSKDGSWFSHLDYATLKPRSKFLNDNDSRKNWNSIGDHIPAYLLNIILSLDPLPEEIDSKCTRDFVNTCRDILAKSTKFIVDHFPEEGIDYVQERFFEDWTRDKTHGWQQDCAIVGHNLKIAWNLTRVANYYDHHPDENAPSNEAIIKLAEKIAHKMVDVGAVDLHRGGCYDAVQRQPKNTHAVDFVWLNTKDFWQQEQGILAYYILYGRTKNPEFLEYARDMTSFWNVFFLNHDQKAAYFRTTDDGLPFVKDGYGAVAGHAIAGYHSFELNFLSHIYIMSYVKSQPFCLYFLPSFRNVNVLPDGIPKSTGLKITKVTCNGIVLEPEESGFKIDGFNVTIPESRWSKQSRTGPGHTLVVQFTPKQLVRPVTEGIIKLVNLKPAIKGKIGVVVEAHFDETETRRFEEFFPALGYEVEYLSYLWNQKFAYYTGNDHLDPLYTFKDITTVDPKDYAGIIFIGGYAMDRIRYETVPVKGQTNQSPAANFLRKLLQISNYPIGTICHSLWLFCATKDTLKGRTVTCANNILYDVENAGGTLAWKADGHGLEDTHVDKRANEATIISGAHPQVVDKFLDVFKEYLTPK